MCSLAFDVRAGFCSSRIGMSVAAFRATDSSANLVAKVPKSFDISKNDFHTFPYGNFNRFIFRCTASAKAACRVSVTCAEPYSPQVAS